MVLIGPDNFPVSEVGEWTLKKHALLSRYIEISASTRRKYTHRSYIDLFSGPGMSYVRETNSFIQGSPLVACEAARSKRSEFTAIHLAEIDAPFRAALEARMNAHGFKATVHKESASEVVERVVQQIDPWGLHLAFVDPFNLAALPFSIIQTLATVKRMDMLIHVSAMDLKREFWSLVESSATLEAFAPGWQTRVNVKQRQDIVRQEIFEHWLSLIRGLRFAVDRKGVEPVVNAKNSELYWLVLISRHQLAEKFWDAARDIDDQLRLL